MKNIFNKFAFFIALSFVFISCGNLTTSENDDSIPQGKGKITISTDLQNGRSVLPTAIEEDTTGLTWELEGICEGKTYSKIWNDTTSEDGVVTTAYNKMKSANDLLLDVGTWNFTLKVKNNSGYVLFATKEVSIETGENKLSFEMKEATSSDIANGETVATGSIEFTLNFPKDVVTKGIATLTTYEGTNPDPQEFTANEGTTNQFLSSITYKNENISAGYYILKIQLQQEKGDATTPAVEYINTYSCLIRVAPGLTSQGEDTLDELAQLYTVTYKLNEGTFDSTTVPTSYNAYTSFELPTPTREGYEFVGWYTDENYATPASNDGTYKISTDTTLYAKWVEAVSGITHANNTLYISSYEGLKVFRDIVNGSLESNITIPGDAANNGASVTCNAGTSDTDYNAELQSNITINEEWTPIGVYTTASSQVPYVGEFKGNNNTITFDDTVSINSQAAGLFGAISTNCNISNLIIEGKIQSSSTSTSYVGGIVGYATGGSVLNCVNRAKIQGTWAGGIAGKTQSTSFNGCVNFGEIN
ncbi:MAG: InlB B-repeat-containing protein [Treponema sp.]|nr:InlB B-repeat-containing protein [Treponema sp.]